MGADLDRAGACAAIRFHIQRIARAADGAPGEEDLVAILATAAFETVFAAVLAPFAQHAGSGHAVNLFRVKGHGRLLNRWKAQ
ncbi:hypothetical protein D3C78_1470300 [compost metagenome]